MANMSSYLDSFPRIDYSIAEGNTTENVVNIFKRYSTSETFSVTTSYILYEVEDNNVTGDISRKVLW